MKSSKYARIYIILLYLLVLQNPLQNYIKIFQYFDEVLALMFFPIAIIYLIRNNGKIKIERKDIIIVICLITIITIGLLANIIYEYQSLTYILSDLLVFLKFFLMYFSVQIILKGKLNGYNKLISLHVKIITFTLFALSIINYIFNFWPPQSYRYGIGVNQICFTHPTMLVAVTVALMCNLVYFKYEKERFYIFTLIMQILLIISTLRMKAIAFVVVSILLMIYVLKVNKKIKVLNVLLVAGICILISYNQIIYYFTDDSFARTALLETSFKIANDKFPLGTGFATFGSFFSGVNYSPVYELYGINNIWGLREDNPAFISDTFWPMIIGQFGYIGTILYMICIMLIFLKIQKKYDKRNKNTYVAKILCLVYLGISSTSESAFVNSLAILLAVLLAL